MSLLGRHHWGRAGGKPDGICQWCGAGFPVDSLRDEHQETCEMRPEGDEG